VIVIVCSLSYTCIYDESLDPKNIIATLLYRIFGYEEQEKLVSAAIR
jgi:hypothetical protein